MFTMNKQLEGFDGLPARDKACIVLKQVFGEATGRVPNGIDAFVDHLIDASLYALNKGRLDQMRKLEDEVRVRYEQLVAEVNGGEDAKTGEAAAGDSPLLEEMAQGEAGEAGAEQLPEGAVLGRRPESVGDGSNQELDNHGYTSPDAKRFTTHEGVASKPGWTDGA